MEKKRAVTSTIYVIALALLWMNIAPRIFPQFFPQRPAPGQQQQLAQGEDAPGDNAPDIDVAPQRGAANDDLGDDPSTDAVDGKPAAPVKLADHPHRMLALGSLDPTSGYFMQVEINTAGAAIETVQLNDPRYVSINDKQSPIKVVGDDPSITDRTLQLSLADIDKQLKPFDTSLATVDWEVVKASPEEVLLQFEAPDGSLRVVKRYQLNQGDPASPDDSQLGYLVDFDLTIENLTNKPQTATYTLLGPVGLPLEDEHNSRTYVELKAGTLDDATDPDDVSDIVLTAIALTKETDKAERLNDPGRLTVWQAPIKYIGADVQYFAAYLLPKEDQLAQKYFDKAQPTIVNRPTDHPEWSNVSVSLTSVPLNLAANGNVKHTFQMFFGPKRAELLEPLGAGGAKALGWFSVVALGMLSMLHFFHTTLLLPYGLAIVLLTVVVRACLFPISKKIAKNQQRMKELQPKMEAIRNKYSDDKEKQAVAMREFMAEYGFNPLAGCLPMFLQLPIFLGLYRALYASVDLRMANFLWVDNLAAPDQLFELPFTVPILGWTFFNLLPLLTVALFTVQQKLFMPPPTSEEQAMQYKMMNFFTLFMGIMFYRVAAGLCVYFIVSSLWGICERKLLEKLGFSSTAPAGDAGSNPPDDRDTGPAGDSPEPKRPGFLAQLLEAADQAKQPTNGSTSKREPQKADTGKRKKKKSKGRR